MSTRADCTCALKVGAGPAPTSAAACPYHGPLYRDVGRKLAELRSALAPAACYFNQTRVVPLDYRALLRSGPAVLVEWPNGDRSWLGQDEVTVRR